MCLCVCVSCDNFRHAFSCVNETHDGASALDGRMECVFMYEYVYVFVYM